jgi:hypothetical protein
LSNPTNVPGSLEGSSLRQRLAHQTNYSRAYGTFAQTGLRVGNGGEECACKSSEWNT